MKIHTFLTFAVLILFLSCRKDTSNNNNNNNSSPNGTDPDNYYIVDGKTVFRALKINDLDNSVICNSQQYSWLNDYGPMPKEFISIFNVDKGLIQVNYTTNNHVKTYVCKFSKAFPLKIENGNTFIEFKDLEFKWEGDTTNTKKISGKVT